MSAKKMILQFILLVLLIGCSLPSKTASDLYSSLDQNLSQQDKVLVNSLESHVQKFHQLNMELYMLLEEMKKDDELEAAVETMQIANEEAMYIFNLIELDDKPSNKKLQELRIHVQASIEKYMKAMNTQLEGITSGDPLKTDKGFEEMKKINEEFDKLVSYMRG